MEWAPAPAALRDRWPTAPALESERDPFDLHAVIARFGRDAVLAPQRELQPLQMLRPQVVAAAAASSGRPDPIVPLAGESFGQQDTTPDAELVEPNDLVRPGAVPDHGTGPAAAVVVICCVVKNAVRAT